MSSYDPNNKYAKTKRKLDFVDKPFHGKLFYIDIKAETVRRKISRRIKDLGGKVEGFLSKDVDLFITDKKNGDLNKRKESSGEFQMVHLPSHNLSRGRALLMKANATANNGTTVGNDIVQNAVQLGVKVEQACVFLKDSSKLLYCLKKPEEKAHDIDGISPLVWKENEKENVFCIKVEDTEQIFKPIIKYFDSFPGLYYNDEVASPFVKGVVLTKQSEKNINRYSTTKTPAITNKGGFCEACDYWYKSSLREHIKSVKHEKFVKDKTNFEHLDAVIHKLPSLSDFFVKLNKVQLKQNINKPENEVESICSKYIQDEESKQLRSECGMQSLEHESIKQMCSTDNEGISKTCTYSVEGNDVTDSEMPSLSKELPCNQYSGNVHNLKLNVIEMPTLDKEHTWMDDTNTQDSGTGPELLGYDYAKNSLCDQNVCVKSKISRSNSDSALPPDDEIQIHVYYSGQVDMDCGDDNAVFMEEITKSTEVQVHVLEENATYNVQRKFSQISLDEDKEETSEVFYSHTKFETESAMCNEKSLVTRKEGILSLNDFSSPNSKSQQQFNFKDLASNWIKDIAKETLDENSIENGHVALNTEEMNCDNSESTETLNPEDYKQYVQPSRNDSKHQGANGKKPISKNAGYNSDDSTESLRSDDLKFFANKKLICDTNIYSLGINSRSDKMSVLCENSNSLDTISLISLPSTPKGSMSVLSRNHVFSENSNSLQSLLCTPDNTLCPNESTNSIGSIQSETPCSCQKSLDIDCENSMQQGPIRIKINLSAIKKEEKKNNRKVKVKRRIFPETASLEEKENNHRSIYCTQQQGEMKIKLCKVVKTPVQKNGDLMTYWKVRKSGGCRLVFSSEKRKASDPISADGDYVSKRRKCIL